MAMVGKVTVVKPLSSVLMPVIRVTDAMTIAVVAFDVVVKVLSRPRRVTSSLRASLATVDGLRVLGVLAKTACGTCGATIRGNSIEVRDILKRTRQAYRCAMMFAKMKKQTWRPLGTEVATPGIPVARQGKADCQSAPL